MISIFTRKKELEDSANLINLYKEKIDRLERSVSTKFVYVQLPVETDAIAYNEKLSEISTDKFFLFWMSKMQYKIIGDFQTGAKESPDFYRGMLATIAMMQADSRDARDTISSLNNSGELTNEV